MIRFEPRYAIEHVVVVGLGGTGSQLARTIARIIYDMYQNGLHTPSILFVDPDRVEEKNVGRQMFTAADVGEFKAELLTRRFNAALGLDIAWDAAPFSPEKHGSRYGTLLVGCVDNHLVTSQSFCARQRGQSVQFSKFLRQLSHTFCAKAALVA
jgi:hypothetical protein